MNIEPKRYCLECGQTLRPSDCRGLYTAWVYSPEKPLVTYKCPTCFMPWTERADMLRPTSQGYRAYDPECGLAWVYFNRKLTHDEILAACCYNNLVARYAGPGRHFQDEPMWSQSATRTVITQRCGFDI